MPKEITKPDGIGNIVTGVVLVLINVALNVFVQVFEGVLSARGLNSVDAFNVHGIIPLIYMVFYIVIPISFYVLMPVGVILIVIGIIKYNKKTI